MKAALTSRTLAFIIAAVVSSNVWAQDIIIEAGKGGQNGDHYQELKGDWADGTSPNEKSQAPGCTATAPSRKVTPQNANAEARFLPKFKQAGHYCVYVTWAKLANAKQVVYIAKHASGQGSRAAIQNGTGYHNPTNGDKWV